MLALPLMACVESVEVEIDTSELAAIIEDFDPDPDPDPDPEPEPEPEPDPEPEPEPDPDEEPTPSAFVLDSEDDAVRFLNTMTFGATMPDVEAALGRHAAELLAEEFEKPATLILPQVLDQTSPTHLEILTFHNVAITADDQLRQRMTFALSQILVASGIATFNPEMVAYYIDQLETNAFGNYRSLLEDVTFSPLMGTYLTYLGNERGDPVTGRVPDENYAREIMQLFTIGLVELNPDGTPQTDFQGNGIETYTNDDISGLARVFTGIGSSSGAFRFLNSAEADRTPMITYPDRHSELEKTFLGLTIPAGTGPDQSIQSALDHLFNHPNVAPFISRQLIQRFTQSDPSPAYVERVASTFERGLYVADNGMEFGTGQRGDLEATLAAILLDPSLFGEVAASNAGKIREPLLLFMNWARSFNATPNATDSSISPGTSRLAQIDDNGLQQQFFHSTSVFNFYRPGFVPPQTMAGDSGRTAPEFQLINEGTYIEIINELSIYVVQNLFNRPTERLAPDYGVELGIADNASDLVDRVNLLLTGRRIPDSAIAEIEAIVSSIIIDDDDPEADRRARVDAAIVAVIARPEFFIQR